MTTPTCDYCGKPIEKQYTLTVKEATSNIVEEYVYCSNQCVIKSLQSEDI